MVQSTSDEPGEPVPPPLMLCVVICVSRLLGIPHHELNDLLRDMQQTEDPLPAEMVDLILQANLSAENKRSLFRRMVAYLFRYPIGYLLNELLRLQRTVEAYSRNPLGFPRKSLIFLVVMLSALATHIGIDARQHVEIIRPFVVHHIQADQRLAPLLEMLRRPVGQGNVRERWRVKNVKAFIQLCKNLLQAIG